MMGTAGGGGEEEEEEEEEAMTGCEMKQLAVVGLTIGLAGVVGILP